MQDNNELYEMNLHDTIDHKGFWIHRVSGGWIYERKIDGIKVAHTFVPYNEEFKSAHAINYDAAYNPMARSSSNGITDNALLLGALIVAAAVIITALVIQHT